MREKEVKVSYLVYNYLINLKDFGFDRVLVIIKVEIVSYLGKFVQEFSVL